MTDSIKVYVVSKDFGHDGRSAPVAVFMTLIAANLYIAQTRNPTRFGVEELDLRDPPSGWPFPAKGAV